MTESAVKIEQDIGDLSRVELERQPDGKVLVIVWYTGDGEETRLHTRTYSSEFWNNPAEPGKIKNAVAEAVDAYDVSLDAEKWGTKFETFLNDLAARSAQADETALSNPVVERFINATESVKILSGENTVWVIELSWGGRTGTIQLDYKAINAHSPQPLTQEFSRVFYDVVDIEDDAWQKIRDEWVDMGELAGYEEQTEIDRRVDKAADEVERRMQVYADPGKLDNGTASAWYDETDTKGITDGGGAVVWVKNELINDILDNDIEGLSVGELGSRLMNEGYTVTSSETRQVAGVKNRYWFFDADRLGVDEYDVHTDDDDDDDGREVEAL